MKVLSKIQIVIVLVSVILLSTSAFAYAKVYPTTPPVGKGRPVVTGPKNPVKPISSPEKPSTPPISPPGLNH